MSKILLVESDERVIGLLKEGLSCEFNSTVKHISSLEGLDQLISKEEFDLIITRNHFSVDMALVEAARGVMNCLYDKRKNTPVIVLGDFEFPSGGFESLSERFRIEELYRLIVKLLDISPEELKQLKLPDYVGLAIDNFSFMESCCCDIYIKLSSKDEDKYLKRINKNELIDKQSIAKYKSSNVDFFYVKKEDHSALLNQLLQISLEKIVQVSKSDNSVHEINSETYDISQNLIDAVGISVHTVRLASAAIGVMRRVIKGHGEISDLLEELLKNKTSYAYKRNYLTSALVYEITPHLNWGSGEQLENQNDKMTFLSFFHDIYLRKEEHLKIFSNEEAKELDMRASELVLNHANKAAKLIQSFPHSPTDVDLLIKQHHGTTNGIGFPSYYSSSISPMVIVFIVLERCAYHILEANESTLKSSNTKNLIFKKLYEEFQQPSYRKVVDILKKVKIL